MSKRFLTPLGLLSATSDPVSASTGDIYFNSSSNVTRVYYGSSWINLSASSTLATHANTASSIAGSLVSGVVASATVSASSNVTASINAGGITSGILSVARGGTGVTSSTGTGSVVLTNSPVWTTGNMSASALNTTISATAGIYGFPVFPGTALNGCIITNRSGGTVNRVHSAQVNVALNGTTASNGFVRGYVETNGGAAVSAAGNVFIYYIAW